MVTYSRILVLAFVFLVSLIALNTQAYAFGGKPEPEVIANENSFDDTPPSEMTLKELAQIYWPDSNTTQLQQEETLNKLQGKKVSWEITVAQIQRDGDGYLIQGQSDKDQIGTFSYVKPKSSEDEELIKHSQRGDMLPIIGVVNGMDMRHIILKPAFIQDRK